MPLVSVVMPSYNHQKYIHKTIDSVLTQSIKDIELIIVDDCSQDDSKKIIDMYQNMDKRIKVIYHEKNFGIAKTINDGMDIAKGKYLAFIGSDDLWARRKLERQVNKLESNNDLVLWCEGDIIDCEDVPTGEKFTEIYDAKWKKKSGKIFEELLAGNYIFGSSLILKRDNTQCIKYDESILYLNDYLYALELSKRYDFYFINESLAQYRVHGMNITKTNSRDCYLDELKLKEYFIKEYRTKISNLTCSKIYNSLGMLYYRLDNRQKAIQAVYNGIIINPLNINNYKCLVIFFTKEKGPVWIILKYLSKRLNMHW